MRDIGDKITRIQALLLPPHTEQQLSKNSEAVSSVLDDYFKFQGNGVY